MLSRPKAPVHSLMFAFSKVFSYNIHAGVVVCFFFFVFFHDEVFEKDTFILSLLRKNTPRHD